MVVVVAVVVCFFPVLIIPYIATRWFGILAAVGAFLYGIDVFCFLVETSVTAPPTQLPEWVESSHRFCSHPL